MDEKSTWMIMFHAHTYEVGLAATSPLRPWVQKPMIGQILMVQTQIFFIIFLKYFFKEVDWTFVRPWAPKDMIGQNVKLKIKINKLPFFGYIIYIYIYMLILQ